MPSKEIERFDPVVRGRQNFNFFYFNASLAVQNKTQVFVFLLFQAKINSELSYDNVYSLTLCYVNVYLYILQIYEQKWKVKIAFSLYHDFLLFLFIFFNFKTKIHFVELNHNPLSICWVSLGV